MFAGGREREQTSSRAACQTVPGSARSAPTSSSTVQRHDRAPAQSPGRLLEPVAHVVAIADDIGDGTAVLRVLARGVKREVLGNPRPTHPDAANQAVPQAYSHPPAECLLWVEGGHPRLLAEETLTRMDLNVRPFE